jgi:hypothetical protein
LLDFISLQQSGRYIPTDNCLVIHAKIFKIVDFPESLVAYFVDYIASIDYRY